MNIPHDIENRGVGTGIDQELTPQVSSPPPPPPQVTKSARANLSRWRHGFKSRWDYQLDKRYFRKDGGIVHGRLTASLVRNTDGSPRLAVGMVEDVTAQREATRAREDRERPHREILSGLADRVLLFDREGRLVFLNSAAQRLLGVSRAEAVGWLCEDSRQGLGTPALGGGVDA
jgi:PAS domain-containing protein